MILYIVIILAVSALFLPLSIKTVIFADVAAMKVYYKIRFPFGVKNCGYIVPTKFGIVAHYSDEKAYAIAYKSLKPDENATNLLSKIKIKTIKSNLILSEPFSFAGLYSSYAALIAGRAICSIIKSKGVNAEFSFNVTFSGNEYIKGFLSNFVVVFNLFVLIETLIIKIIRGIFNG